MYCRDGGRKRREIKRVADAAFRGGRNLPPGVRGDLYGATGSAETYRANNALTHARAALAVQVVQAAEALFAARTVGQVALARLRDHAFGHDGRAHGLVARVTDARERGQRADDDGEPKALHVAETGTRTRDGGRTAPRIRDTGVHGLA